MKLTWTKAALVLALLLAASSLHTPYPERLYRLVMGEKRRAKPVSVVPRAEKKKKAPTAPPRLASPSEIEARPWNPLKDLKRMPQIVLPPFPPVIPTRIEPGNYANLSRIDTGFNLRSYVQFAKGSTASQDRKQRNSYATDLKLNLLLPTAADGQSLLHANPKLPQVLKNYFGLLAEAKVSRWYKSMYNHKMNHVRKNAASLDRILSKHNYYDTDTILEIEAPDTKRKLVWIQADMDVVSDGSDGDRLPDMPERIKNSDFYQPSTSYRWLKKTDTPNPLLPYWEKRLEKYRKQGARSSVISHAQRVIFDLKKFSFLLADYDPFIVLPLTLREGNSPYMPEPGDYAVVIVGKKIYPAIFGDYGPRFKSGEASLRLCQEVNPRSSSYSRAVSDLSVSYIVFPGTKEKVAGPIDYTKLYETCYRLLSEIGGLEKGIKLEHLEDKLAPKKL